MDHVEFGLLLEKQKSTNHYDGPLGTHQKNGIRGANAKALQFCPAVYCISKPLYPMILASFLEGTVQPAYP